MTPSPKESDVKDIFIKILHNYNELKYSDKIKDTVIMECEDPILKSVAFLFIEKYGRALEDYRNNEEHEQFICKYLEDWVRYIKYFYTLGGTCEYKKKLWIKYIHDPWRKIEQSFGGVNLSCDFKTDKFSGSFEPELFNYNCNDHITIAPIIPVSVGFSLFGIALICIFLSKFTPVVSWIHSHREIKKKTFQNINNEDKQEFSENFLWNSDEHTEHNINHLSYHPRRN
ncbi:PIR Superfamily Protein [Plasmodium ovale curtisi]|uniref:PIR Superfamily Protein n=1 Tax=Plasmodium ovale curtisi TaxID=864141 RepID=A0A1A8XA01_PLAOA|nr:PIR Superfamily Protein [Plasmodium ovale curtisi]